jgi:hypothetical protein
MFGNAWRIESYPANSDQVWSYLKISGLVNVACDLLSELDALIQRAKKRMQRKPELIQVFSRVAAFQV